MSDETEWANRLVERLRQNPLRRTRGARDFAELETEVDHLCAENTALLRRAERAERILAALREPSEAIVDAVTDLGDSFEYLSRLDAYTAIRAAVAAAEQEVGRE